jgi:hypothetical protein
MTRILASNADRALHSALECGRSDGAGKAPDKALYLGFQKPKNGQLRRDPLEFLETVSKNSVFRTACTRDSAACQEPLSQHLEHPRDPYHTTGGDCR